LGKIVSRLAGAGVKAVVGNWVPWALGAALVAALVAGFFTVRAAWRAEGAAKVIADDAKAVAKQKEEDAALSARLVNQQREVIRELERSAAEATGSVNNAPVSTGCGPSTDTAVDWLRRRLPSGPGQ
jgi:hypothetical protein